MHELIEHRADIAEVLAEVAKKDPEAIPFYSRYYAALIRDDFWQFRRYIHPHLIEGWWIKETAYELQDFYEAFVRGERPKMVLESPPQHGKSMTATDFIAWVAGRNPNLSAIYASYSDDLGMKANAALQRIYLSERYQKVFGEGTRIADVGLAHQLGITILRYARTSSHLEYVGARGSFRNVTVNGGVTGQSLDLGVIDDPIKGRAEANSVTIRDKTWSWLTDDFFTRFSEQAALLIIMTRWHIDDPMSRFLEKFPEARIVRYPAIATQDEKYRKKGVPLFPELKSLAFLNERRKMMTRASFEALYQQSPIVVGGEMFPVERFKPINRVNKSLIKRSIRYWDKAGTEDGGAYTAGVLMHEMKDDVEPSFVVEDVVHGQWSALTRERRIRQAAEFDQSRYGYGAVTYYVEQELGSGGKESVERTIRDTLRGFAAYPDKVTGDKVTRAEPYAAQVEAGNVGIVVADWNKPFLAEHETSRTARWRRTRWTRPLVRSTSWPGRCTIPASRGLEDLGYDTGNARCWRWAARRVEKGHQRFVPDLRSLEAGPLACRAFGGGDQTFVIPIRARMHVVRAPARRPRRFPADRPLLGCGDYRNAGMDRGEYLCVRLGVDAVRQFR